MTASDPVGNVTKVVILNVDSNANHYETTPNARSFFKPDTTYANADISSRALFGLSRRTYEDTNLITTISVNDVLAED